MSQLTVLSRTSPHTTHHRCAQFLLCTCHPPPQTHHTVVPGWVPRGTLSAVTNTPDRELYAPTATDHTHTARTSDDCSVTNTSSPSGLLRVSVTMFSAENSACTRGSIALATACFRNHFMFRFGFNAAISGRNKIPGSECATHSWHRISTFVHRRRREGKSPSRRVRPSGGPSERWQRLAKSTTSSADVNPLTAVAGCPTRSLASSIWFVTTSAASAESSNSIRAS